jgi:general secretion pathway protein D
MMDLKRLTALSLAGLLLAGSLPIEARTRKGDQLLARALAAQEKSQWDEALALYEQALAKDPSDIKYRMGVQRARFEGAQVHIEKGLRLRNSGELGEALLELQKAAAMNPGSSVAAQEASRTLDMIERERKRVLANGHESTPAEKGLTPADEVRRDTRERISRLLPVPELRPLNPAPLNLKVKGQGTRVLFETIGKLAGINVLWDPEFSPIQKDRIDLDVDNATLDEALDYASVLTKSFWKPLSTNAIFVTNDNANKRRDYEEQVTRVFYLSNITLTQDLTEIINAVRSLADLTRVFPCAAQNAIVVRGESDKVALAEKVITDLDRPKSEVLVDILVMEATTNFKRTVTAALASTGLSLAGTFTPTTKIGTAGTTSTAATVPIKNLGKLSSDDFSVTLPGATLEAVLSDSGTKVLQAPQLRAVDNVKSSVKIGDKQPTASGSYTSGLSSSTTSALVSTSFQYIDVGVNVDVTPHVHDNGEVSMHIELEVSSVTSTVTIGNVSEPVISQRKVSHDIRIAEGQVGIMGGLITESDTKTVTGIPGLSSIPLLRRLFTGEAIGHERRELLIAVVPHILRRPEFTPDNLRGIAAGSSTTVRVNYAPKTAAPAVPVAAPAPVPAVTAPAAPAAAVPVPQAVVTALPVTQAAPPATAPILTALPTSTPAAPIGAGSGPSQPPAAPTGPARVFFNQSKVQTTAPGSFAISLNVENMADLGSAPMVLQFDPKVLRLNDALPGALMTQGGQTPVFTKTIKNDTGQAMIQLTRAQGSAGATGSGVLLTLVFQTVAKGTATVSLPTLTLRNSQGQPIVTAAPQFTAVAN